MALIATFGTPKEKDLNVIVPVAITKQGSTPSVKNIPVSSVVVTKHSSSVGAIENVGLSVIYKAVNSFELVFDCDVNIQIAFTLSIDGYTFDGSSIDELESSNSINISVDTREPTIVYPTGKFAYVKRDDVIDFIMFFNRKTKLRDPVEVFNSQSAVYADLFYTSVMGLPQPTVYISASDQSYPDTIPEELPVGAWSAFSQSSDPSRLYVVRYSEIPESISGSFDILLKPGTVSSDILQAIQ
ncbi:MAG: hypothetical protein OXE50_15630 [Chloroflexi bacterium]|nr:hypothetical protein [Chloroflexota bacterium]